ncbi:MAG: MTH1187 family thiamine-binding protein [bacterium]
MPIFEISVVPVGTDSTSVSPFVRAAVEVIKKSGLNYQVTPMGTCIEGELDCILPLIKNIHETLFRMGCHRLVTTVKIDDRRDKEITMQGKIARVSD